MIEVQKIGGWILEVVELGQGTTPSDPLTWWENEDNDMVVTLASAFVLLLYNPDGFHLSFLATREESVMSIGAACTSGLLR